MAYRYQPTGDINFTALVEAVAAEQGVSQETAQEFVQSTLDVIGRTMAVGHRVKLTNFGTFEPRTRQVGAGALGGRVKSPMSVRTVLFRLSGRLHDAVRNGQPVDTLKKSPSN